MACGRKRFSGNRHLPGTIWGRFITRITAMTSPFSGLTSPGPSPASACCWKEGKWRIPEALNRQSACRHCARTWLKPGTPILSISHAIQQELADAAVRVRKVFGRNSVGKAHQRGESDLSLGTKRGHCERDKRAAARCGICGACQGDDLVTRTSGSLLHRQSWPRATGRRNQIHAPSPIVGEQGQDHLPVSNTFLNLYADWAKAV